MCIKRHAKFILKNTVVRLSLLVQRGQNCCQIFFPVLGVNDIAGKICCQITFSSRKCSRHILLSDLFHLCVNSKHRWQISFTASKRVISLSFFFFFFSSFLFRSKQNVVFYRNNTKTSHQPLKSRSTAEFALSKH